MNTVQPIRDKKKIDAMKKVLMSSNYRDFLLFTMGINSGLRISDLLTLTFGDVVKNNKVVNEISIKEKKTEKWKTFRLSDKTKKSINEYLERVGEYDLKEPLFFSRKKTGGERIAITRQQAHYILSNCAELVGIDEKIGTHSLRKSFGYHAYKNGVDLAYLQKIFNHTYARQTLDYIGITKEEIDNIYVNMDL